MTKIVAPIRGLTAAGIGATPLLTPTAVKTAPYAAAVNDLALMNVAGGGNVVTLPTAPADKAQVGYRAIGATTAVPLVVNVGAGDTIGLAGATAASIPLADETVVLQYGATSKQWLAVSNVKTQASIQGLSNTVYRHGPPPTATTYPVGTFVYDVDASHLYEIGA